MAPSRTSGGDSTFLRPPDRRRRRPTLPRMPPGNFQLPAPRYGRGISWGRRDQLGASGSAQDVGISSGRRDQYGGQGMAGHSGFGLGKTPDARRSWIRARVASISRFARSSRSSRPSAPSRASRTRRNPASSSSENGSPSQAQSTVRSLGSIENVTP